MSNHDLPRAISRYARGEDDSMGKIIMTILLTLRGTPFMYQGEEIGMRDISLHRGEILDPPGRKYWPFYYGRDGCRSPMQWDSTSHAGFSPVMPWLKVHPDYRQRNVAAQELDPGSLLNFTRSLVTLRRSRAALRQGDFLPVLATRHVLVYMRKSEDEIILVAMNFDRRPRSFVLPGRIRLRKNLLTSVKDPGEDVLQPREVSLWEL
jgi:alpha-glucosidase